MTGLEFSDILVQVNSEKFTASILLTVLVSALWEMFFTYIQKQNWLKSHHIVQNNYFSMAWHLVEVIYLIEVIEKHLTHLVNRNCCIYGTRKT